MLLLPIHVNMPIRRPPTVNYLLIAANVLVFLLDSEVLAGSIGGLTLKSKLMLWAESPRWYQFLSSMFLHGSWWHLGGNMVFLWVFGNSLNNKLGNFTYLLFYLASGLFAGAGYVLFMSSPVVGASGAIFGVAAGFLVLFPFCRVTALYWIFVIFGFIEVSGLVIVGYYVLLNVLSLLTGQETGVAYLAHLSGALFGFVAAMILLATGAISRDQFDLLAVIRRWHSRQAFRGHMTDPARQAEAHYGRVAMPAEARQIDSRPVSDPRAQRIAELRQAIVAAIQASDADSAGRLYRDLLQIDPAQALPPRQQRDLGNYLMTDRQYELAATAYESLLANFPTFEDVHQIELLLGLLHARYLHNPVRAKLYLEQCAPKLRDPNQQAMCREELDRVSSMLR